MLRRRSLQLLRRIRLGRREERFATVYAEGDWGADGGLRFCSGYGSRPENFAPYAAFVSDYIRRHGIRRVLDIGCGDFRVGRAVDLHGAEYLGVDIVSALVAHNTRQFGSDTVRFARLDAGIDPLPAADLCLVKQVLQHWSDADILSFLPRLDAFEHVLVLDGILLAGATPGRNQNIPTGGFRCGGLYLEAPPFDADVSVLLEYVCPKDIERFRLVRYRGWRAGERRQP